MGDIDIGGMQRFGPQSSGRPAAGAERVQRPGRRAHARRAHLLKAGALVERYQDNMVNPTFSLGIYTFANLSAFLEQPADSFVGLTPEAQFDRYWRFTLFGGYVQDDDSASPRLTLNAGLRYEFDDDADRYLRARLGAAGSDRSPAPTSGRSTRIPTYTNLSPRVGAAWDVVRRRPDVGARRLRLYFNTNNQQNLIVTVTNPPATPRPVIVNPTFPNPPFERAGAISIRPISGTSRTRALHVWNVTVQRAAPGRTAVTVGYAGSRGGTLRSNPTSTCAPDPTPDGTPFFAAGTPRPNRSFSTIELKSSDGDSWYNALIFECAAAGAQRLSLQSSYTLSNSEDTTQASTFFSDATNGTTSAMPEFIPGYNKGCPTSTSRTTGC